MVPTIYQKYPIEALESVRAGLRDEYDRDENDRFDKNLYFRLQEDDIELCRYMRRRRGNIQKSVNFILSVLEWRKSQGVSELSEGCFPSEFFDYGSMYVYGQDREGNSILHVRVVLFAKHAELADLMKKFALYWLQKADTEVSVSNGRNGWILVLDCTDASPLNGDVEFPLFINNILRDYFPAGQQYILVVNLPWIFATLKSLIFAMLPDAIRNRVKFCDNDNIINFISAENLPDYLGGKVSARQYRWRQIKPISTKEMVESGILKIRPKSMKNIQKFYDKLSEFLHNESMSVAAP